MDTCVCPWISSAHAKGVGFSSHSSTWVIIMYLCDLNLYLLKEWLDIEDILSLAVTELSTSFFYI